MESTSTTSLEESIKRTAISPVTNDGKKPKTTQVDALKLMIKIPNGDVDEQFFDKLSMELVSLLQSLPMDAHQPMFSGSGFLRGIGWFCAEDDFSMKWLKSSLIAIKAKQILPHFEVLPYTDLPILRRVMVNLPLVPRLNRDAHTTILNMLNRLNPNLNTKYWKVVRILPRENNKQSIILGIDEESIEEIKKQKNRIHYALSQVFVKNFPMQTKN